jgi:hypothetical protein
MADRCPLRSGANSECVAEHQFRSFLEQIRQATWCRFTEQSQHTVEIESDLRRQT